MTIHAVSCICNGRGKMDKEGLRREEGGKGKGGDEEVRGGGEGRLV